MAGHWIAIGAAAGQYGGPSSLGLGVLVRAISRLTAPLRGGGLCLRNGRHQGRFTAVSCEICVRRQREDVAYWAVRRAAMGVLASR
jgi:hypothetical protein